MRAACLLSVCSFYLSFHASADFKNKELERLIDELIRLDFKPYLTSVGGSGLGILSPYPEHRTSSSTRGRGSDPHAVPVDGQVTPPETPNPEIVDGAASPQAGFDPLRPTFEATVTTDLPDWATGLGRWLYV